MYQMLKYTHIWNLFTYNAGSTTIHVLVVRRLDYCNNSILYSVTTNKIERMHTLYLDQIDALDTNPIKNSLKVKIELHIKFLC